MGRAHAHIMNKFQCGSTSTAFLHDSRCPPSFLIHAERMQAREQNDTTWHLAHTSVDGMRHSLHINDGLFARP